MINWSVLKSANAALNAFVDWDEGAAAGEGMLADLTVGVKANIMVRGLPWTGGSAIFRDRIADRDAAVVAALRGAGAAILGTLNMEEAALGAKTDNPWFGATQNPHHIGYTPGGSSGGSAAAVAARLCDIALGTDTMGSIRIPAAYCGIYGFKPAHAAISQDGLEMTLPSLDTIGPLARDIDTLERVARVISDFGEQDQFELMTLADLGGVECAPDVARNFSIACDDAGVDAQISLAMPLSRLRFAGFIAASKWLSAHLDGADRSQISPALAKLLQYGPRRLEEDWTADQRILNEGATALRDALGAKGILMLPTAPQTAFLHSEAAPANQADFTCLANVAGLPAISIPSGWGDNGMPIGVQLIGQPGFEKGLFAAARGLDAKCQGYRSPTIAPSL